MGTKMAIKSDKMTPFGGIFYVLNQFDRFISRTVDTELGLRCVSFGYQYSEIFRALFSIFLCGGTRIKGLPVHIENRDGNTNVRFMQEETLLIGVFLLMIGTWRMNKLYVIIMTVALVNVSSVR